MRVLVVLIFYIPSCDEVYEKIMDTEDIPHLRYFIKNYFIEDAKKLHSLYTSGCIDEIDPCLDLEWIEELIEEEEEKREGYDSLLEKITEWYFCSIQTAELDS